MGQLDDNKDDEIDASELLSDSDERFQKNKKNTCKICHEFKFPQPLGPINRLSSKQRQENYHDCSNIPCECFQSCLFIGVRFSLCFDSTIRVIPN